MCVSRQRLAMARISSSPCVVGVVVAGRRERVFDLYMDLMFVVSSNLRVEVVND